MFSRSSYYILEKCTKEANSILTSRGIILKNKSGDFKNMVSKRKFNKDYLKKINKEIWVKSTALGRSMM